LRSVRVLSGRSFDADRDVEVGQELLQPASLRVDVSAEPIAEARAISCRAESMRRAQGKRTPADDESNGRPGYAGCSGGFAGAPGDGSSSRWLSTIACATSTTL